MNLDPITSLWIVLAHINRTIDFIAHGPMGPMQLKASTAHEFFDSSGTTLQRSRYTPTSNRRETVIGPAKMDPWILMNPFEKKTWGSPRPSLSRPLTDFTRTSAVKSKHKQYYHSAMHPSLYPSTTLNLV